LGQLLFSKNKDRTPREFTTNVVYSIECTCNELYIGNTSQWALTRFKQHQSRNSEHSALSAHLIESGHQISFDKMKFIANEPHRRIREIKEMAYIKSSANINNQIDCVPLGSIFDNVLKQCITL
jgi:predicted GIY-YIG superfamily endonuclease